MRKPPKRKATQQICSICQEEYEGWGNNAQPINDGQCCDACNYLVLQARFSRERLGLPHRDVRLTGVEQGYEQ